MLKIVNLVKTYNKDLTPINGLNLEVNKGDVLTLIGPSGTGKSTLLRMINLLETPTSGQIFFKDQEITAKKVNKSLVRMKIGMVFQSYPLFNTKTVLQNVMCGPIDLLKVNKKDAEENAIKLLKQVGMYDHREHFPHELSGGQRQRVAIARALSMNPEILLLDEPTSALDPKMVIEVEEVVANLANSGMTMIIVTHDMKFAERVSNKVAFLSCGKVQEIGTPKQIFHHPQSIDTLGFIESVSYFSFNLHDETFSIDNVITRIDSFKTDSMSKEIKDIDILLFKELYKAFKKDKESTKSRMAIGFSNNGDFFWIALMYDGKSHNLFNLINSKKINKIKDKHISNIDHRDLNGDKGYSNFLRLKIK